MRTHKDKAYQDAAGPEVPPQRACGGGWCADPGADASCPSACRTRLLGGANPTPAAEARAPTGAGVRATRQPGRAGHGHPAHVPDRGPELRWHGKSQFRSVRTPWRAGQVSSVCLEADPCRRSCGLDTAPSGGLQIRPFIRVGAGKTELPRRSSTATPSVAGRGPCSVISERVQPAHAMARCRASGRGPPCVCRGA